MKLEVHERMALTKLLPTTDTFAGIKTIRRAREAISFTPDEVEFYEISSTVGANGVPMTNWNPKKAAEQIKDIPIEQYIMDIIRVKLSEMDKKKEITDEFISLFDKFVVMYK